MLRSIRRYSVFGVAAILAACSGNEGAQGADTAAANPAAVDTAMTPAAGDALLDPNAATAGQLAAIPGVDAALADSLIAHRPYADMRGVDAVLAKTLSEEQRDTVYTRLFKPLDLNTATPEEITLIPGVGDRMRHEFEEYRPYTAMAQFRREIGKYVDEAEVARLERYVRIGGQ